MRHATHHAMRHATQDFVLSLNVALPPQGKGGGLFGRRGEPAAGASLLLKPLPLCLAEEARLTYG